MSLFIRIKVHGLVGPVFIESAMAVAGALSGFLSVPILANITGSGQISALTMTVSHPITAAITGTGGFSATVVP